MWREPQQSTQLRDRLVERYSRKWRSLHLYLHDYEKQERFLIDCVRPLVREISETFDQFRSSLATQAAGYLTEGSDRSVTEESRIFVAPREEWQKDGSVAEAEYEPEFDRYGGYHAVQYSEDAFCYSSALSLQLIDHTQASLSQRLMLSRGSAARSRLRAQQGPAFAAGVFPAPQRILAANAG